MPVDTCFQCATYCTASVPHCYEQIMFEYRPHDTTREFKLYATNTFLAGGPVFARVAHRHSYDLVKSQEMFDYTCKKNLIGRVLRLASHEEAAEMKTYDACVARYHREFFTFGNADHGECMERVKTFMGQRFDVGPLVTLALSALNSHYMVDALYHDFATERHQLTQTIDSYCDGVEHRHESVEMYETQTRRAVAQASHSTRRPTIVRGEPSRPAPVRIPQPKVYIGITQIWEDEEEEEKPAVEVKKEPGEISPDTSSHNYSPDDPNYSPTSPGYSPTSPGNKPTDAKEEHKNENSQDSETTIPYNSSDYVREVEDSSLTKNTSHQEFEVIEIDDGESSDDNPPAPRKPFETHKKKRARKQDAIEINDDEPPTPHNSPRKTRSNKKPRKIDTSTGICTVCDKLRPRRSLRSDVFLCEHDVCSYCNRGNNISNDPNAACQITSYDPITQKDYVCNAPPRKQVTAPQQIKSYRLYISS